MTPSACMNNDTQQKNTPARWSIRTALVSVYMARYCCFEGRASRKEFWYAVLPTLVFIFLYANAMNITADFIGGHAGIVVRMMMLTLLLVAVVMALIPWIALLVRRLHDMGLGGWYALIILVPWVGRLFILGCCLFPSEGANKWGRRSDSPAEW